MNYDNFNLFTDSFTTSIDRQRCRIEFWGTDTFFYEKRQPQIRYKTHDIKSLSLIYQLYYSQVNNPADVLITVTMSRSR